VWAAADLGGWDRKALESPMGEPWRPRPLNSESTEGLRKQHELADTRETGWFGARSISEGIENNGGTGNPYTAKATGRPRTLRS
jgi:hypothetical protein